MTPALHHVAFGALAKSRITGFTPKGNFTRPTVPATPSYEDCSIYPRRSWQRDACNDRNDDKEEAYEDLLEEYEENEEAFANSVGWDGTGETNSDGFCRTEAVRTNGRRASDTRNEERGSLFPGRTTTSMMTPIS
jgi:hypothetical protein